MELRLLITLLLATGVFVLVAPLQIPSHGWERFLGSDSVNCGPAAISAITGTDRSSLSSVSVDDRTVEQLGLPPLHGICRTPAIARGAIGVILIFGGVVGGATTRRRKKAPIPAVRTR